MPLLDARGLTKRYGAREVVAAISLAIEPGETVGLLGPNGAGKSTTVGMLAGLVTPDAGTVTIAGHPVSDGASGIAARRRVGVVPQELALYEGLPARANLELFGALYGLSGAPLAERVDAALALVGLADRSADKPATFSGGMKRRLNIAAALIHDPDVLILDEPTVGVDPQSRNAIFDNLEELARRGKGLLYTTHYMEEAERLCDRIVIVDHGRVVASDTQAGLARLVPQQRWVEVDVSGPLDAPALAAAMADLPAPPTVESGRVRATVGNLGRDTPRLLAAIVAGGGRVERVASARQGLEDVFLALTGKALRD